MARKARITKTAAAAPTQNQSTNVAPTTTPITKKRVLYFIECSEGGILPKHVDEIEAKLDKSSGDLLYLVLHTFGGDIYSAVRIMRILQYKFKEIKVIVPDFVYSSGTIMSLGGDEIHMAVDASIGPLDKPLEHPTDGSDISSLDMTQALTNLASTSTSIANSIYFKLRKGNMKLSKAQATKLAFETATKIITPIVDKIDPYNLQQGFRQAQIGLSYAIDMLLTKMMAVNVKEAMDTSRKLVNDYPSHDYGIYRDEAKFWLMLKIHNLEDLPEWTIFESRFKELKRKLHVIEYLEL